MRAISWLYKESIWHPDAVPVLEQKYAAYKRVLLPVVDLLFILLGVTASLLGSPSIEAVFGVPAARTLCLTFAFVGFAALLGVSFPRLWVLETYAKVALVGGHVAFAASLMSVVIVSGDPNRTYLVVFAAISLAHILFRLSILRHERVARDYPEGTE